MALFSTTTELREFYPARVTFDLDDLKPTLESVEQEFLVEQVMGRAFFDELVEALQDDDLDDTQEEILRLCRRVVAPLAIQQFTGMANVEFSSGGLVTGQTEHKRPASEWRTRDLERTLMHQAYRALDVLIAHLLEHEDELDSWVDSEQHADLTGGWLRGTRDFQRHVNINNSGYLYLRMRGTMRRIEQGPVQDVLCSTAVADDLRTKWDADTLSAAETEVLDTLQQAVVHLTMADSIVELSLNMDGTRGVWTFNTVLGQTSGGPMPASDARLQNRITHHQNLGKHFLAKLQKKLQAMAEADASHPYRSTPCYVDPNATPAEPFQTDSPVGGFLG